MNAPAEQLQVSVVIPVYCGAETIGPLVDLLIESLKTKFTFEIILVNDCSPDQAEQVCTSLYQKYPAYISFLSLAKNVGEHNAVMAGLNQSCGSWVFIVDDDFQNPVSEVVKLISYSLASAFDVVYTQYPKKNHSLFRNLGSWFNDKVATFMLQKPANLYLSSFKGINRFLVDEIVKYTLPFPYIDGLVLRTTSNIGKIEVEHRERTKGKSGYTFKKLVSLWINTFTNFSVIPLRIATGMGFAFAFLGFLIVIEMIIERATNPSFPHGYVFLVLLITMFAAIQLISIGIAGEYIGRMFMYQNKKPQYSICRMLTKENTEADSEKK